MKIDVSKFQPTILTFKAEGLNDENIIRAIKKGLDNYFQWDKIREDLKKPLI